MVCRSRRPASGVAYACGYVDQRIRGSGTVATLSRGGARSAGGHAVQEAEHGLQPPVAVRDGDVEAGDRRLLAGRAKLPREAALVVVGVDRPGEPEDEGREL